MAKSKKTVEFDAVNVSNDEVSEISESESVAEFIPTSVNSSLGLILEMGVGNSDQLSAEQKDALLSYLKPFRGEKEGRPTNYFNISGGQNDPQLEGVKFVLLVPIEKRNKKGKVTDRKNELLEFTVKNIVSGITKFASGKTAEYSSLSISALYRENAIRAIDISF